MVYTTTNKEGFIMNGKITEKESLLETIRIWDYIAEKSLRSKDSVPDIDLYLNKCPLCEYVSQFPSVPGYQRPEDLDCQGRCPLANLWGGTPDKLVHTPCEWRGTPYYNWWRSSVFEDKETRSESARALASLVRNKLDQLNYTKDSLVKLNRTLDRNKRYLEQELLEIKLKLLDELVLFFVYDSRRSYK
jgi:hypothetical protein